MATARRDKLATPHREKGGRFVEGSGKREPVQGPCTFQATKGH